MRTPDGDGSGGPAGDPVDLEERKERVLHTRVPESLDRHIKRRARSLGMSVSTVVRNVLLNTFGLVEDIVTDSTNIALAFAGSETADRSRARGGAPPEAGSADGDVVAWQEAVLNVNAVCERCNAILRKGGRAGIGSGAGPDRRRSSAGAASASWQERPGHPARSRADEPGHTRGRRVTVRDLPMHGHRLAFRTAGEGPVVVLVHGMAGSSATWEPILPTLARRFTVLAPDLLGHGASAKPLAEYSVSAHANLLRDLLLALGHERATLVGQSFGGGVVMQMAYQFPELCERLVLVSSGGLGREVGGLLRALTLPGAEQVFPLFCSAALRDTGSRLGAWLGGIGLRAAPVLEEVWRCYASLADRETRAAFFRTLRAVIDTGGQTVCAADRLYLASYVPTLIVWGAEDALIPVRHGQSAHEAMPGSRLAIFDDVGHFPHLESPERFVTTLIEFIDATRPVSLSAGHLREVLRHRAAPTNHVGGSP